jgi:competence protein ComEC
MMGSARVSGEQLSRLVHVPRFVAMSAVVALVVGAMRMRHSVAAVVVVAAGALGASSAFASLTGVSSGDYSGDAVLVVDASWRFGSANAIVDINDKRYVITARDVAGRRLARARMGDVVQVTGSYGAVKTSARLVARHVVGRFTADEVGETIGPGAPLYRAANALRSLLVRAASHMPRDEASLYLGLVVGDDRSQSRAMVTSFRSSGLSHLTAVSGQNVAFLLAALAPFLTRTRTWWRVALTMAFLAWFVVVTRAEPSVIRAAVTAAITAIGVARGVDVPARRMLALAMMVLLIVDPLLAWSVGFWMSVAATAGLVVLSPRLKSMMRGPHWLRTALATTIGAQLAVAPIVLHVFGRVSVTAVATNLVAVPIAGAVMFVGLPLGLSVGIAGGVLEWWNGSSLGVVGNMAMAPITWATRFVWWVAVVGSLQQ